MKEALFYEQLEENKVHCTLCPQSCVIAQDKRGFCYARINRDGRLYSEIYNRAMAANLDPVEKKPLYHFHPGELIYSVGTRGCNQRCDFCQNYHMLQPGARVFEITAQRVVKDALDSGSFALAYTYNEPFIWYEFILECAELARTRGLKNVLVTNGLYNPEPFRRLAPFIDAMNVDVKSMKESFYKKVCKSKLEPVLETCRAARAAGIHLEITNLVIPTLNDSAGDVEKLVGFVAGLGVEVPLHFSAYFPCYRMTIEPTPLSTLLHAREIAEKELHYVYLGNVRAAEGSNTRCPKCGNLLVKRDGYHTSVTGIENGACGNCGRAADFVGLSTGSGLES
jgi:pyruvate formate lyase activating enzyme